MRTMHGPGCGTTDIDRPFAYLHACLASALHACRPITQSFRQPRRAGIVFVGGFSYADVMDSAKGWAGTIRFNDRLWRQFQAFYARPDTFSLGVCNGCQLMALLGWVPATGQVRPAGWDGGLGRCRVKSVNAGRQLLEAGSK